MKCADCGRADPSPQLRCLGRLEEPPTALFWLMDPTKQYWTTACRNCEKALARASAWERNQDELDRIEAQYDVRGLNDCASTTAPVSIPPQAELTDD